MVELQSSRTFASGDDDNCDDAVMMNLSRNVRVKVDQGGKGWRFRCVVIAKAKGEEGESRRRAEVEVARIPADDIDRKNKGRLGKRR